MTRSLEPEVMNAAQAVPAVPGFYWARWQAPWGHASDGLPAGRWEVVEVFVNSNDETSDALMVLVPGVETPQMRGDFVWGDGPIAEPANRMLPG